ncbi:transposase domain-containing protein [Rhodobacter sp. CZR27]|nr:transposase domain-containing protein [Rhodobacter sp. CZR27]
MSDVNPVSYIAETLRAILDGHPASRIEDLGSRPIDFGRIA